MKRIARHIAGGLFLLSFPISFSSTSSAATSIPPCTNSQLIVLGSGLFGAAGTGFMAIDIANDGAACRIGGYPVVKFLDAKGVAVDHRDIYQSSMVFAEPRDETTTLPHGVAASFGISWSDNEVNNEPYDTTCPKTSIISFVVRRGVGDLSQSLEVVGARPCNGALWVTPIERQAWPRPNG